MAEASGDPLFQSSSSASGRDAARGVLLSALKSPDVIQSLRQLDAAGYFATWLPEAEALKGVVQPKEHYWDVYEHSIETVAAVEDIVSKILPRWKGFDLEAYLSEPVDKDCDRLCVLKLAALLHDIAKPQTKTFEPSGRMRFFGHSEAGAEVAREILARFGFSEKVQEMVGLMVEHHLRPGQLAGRAEEPTERALYRYFRDTDGIGIEILLLNMADHKAMKGPTLSEDEWRRHVERTRRIIEDYLAKQRASKLVKLVSGHDIMARFHLQPGPLVGELLSLVDEAQARGEVKDKAQALALVERALNRRGRTGPR